VVGEQLMEKYRTPNTEHGTPNFELRTLYL